MYKRHFCPQCHRRNGILQVNKSISIANFGCDRCGRIDIKQMRCVCLPASVRRFSCKIVNFDVFFFIVRGYRKILWCLSFNYFFSVLNCCITNLEKLWPKARRGLNPEWSALWTCISCSGFLTVHNAQCAHTKTYCCSSSLTALAFNLAASQPYW